MIFGMSAAMSARNANGHETFSKFPSISFKSIILNAFRWDVLSVDHLQLEHTIQAD